MKSAGTDPWTGGGPGQFHARMGIWAVPVRFYISHSFNPASGNPGKLGREYMYRIYSRCRPAAKLNSSVAFPAPGYLSAFPGHFKFRSYIPPAR